MIKHFTIHHFILLLSLGFFSLLASCAKKSDSGNENPAAEYTTSLIPVPSTVNGTDTEKREYKPLIWEIKWASRRVLEEDNNHNKFCKTEFTNPYNKSIKQIKVGYEIKYKNRSEPVIHEKVIQLNLQPNEKKTIDTGIGCHDFYMYEVIFEDGEVI